MNWPAYPEYKYSGIDWLDNVPGHWSMSKLGYEAWVRARLGWKGLKADEYIKDGVAFLSTPNIRKREIDFENVDRITDERFLESPEIILRVGDVLLAKDGSTLGSANLVRYLPEPTTVNGSIAVLTPGRAFDSGYLFHLILSSLIQSRIQMLKGGMGVPHLFQDDIRRFDVPIPPLEEQVLISSFLDLETEKIDALIDKQNQLIAILREDRTATITHAVTKGLNPNTKMRDSGVTWLGSVPQHWTVAPVKRFASAITDGAHISPETEGGEFDFVSTRDIGDSGINFATALKTTSASFAYLVRSGCRPYKGDLLFSKDGTVGKTALVTTDHEFVVASSLIIIRSDHHVMAAEYLHFAFQSASAIKQVDSFVKGAGLPRLSIANLRRIAIAVPPLAEQAEIAAQLNRQCALIDELIDKSIEVIATLREYRSALITAAVTGKIDVREAA